LYFQWGDWEEAKKYLEVVARSDPEDQSVQQALRMINEALRAKARALP